MSSTFPSPRVNGPVGLGLVSCEKDRKQELAYAEDQSFCDLSSSTVGLGDLQGSREAAASEDSDCCDKALTGNQAEQSAEELQFDEPFIQDEDSGAIASKRALPRAAEELTDAASKLANNPSTEADSPPKTPAVLHRIAEVRQSQGLTERTIAKRMGIDIRSYRRLECATTDITVSELLAAQKALEVPLVDLLQDTESLSRPVEERAQMVRVMKTAVAIREAQSAGRIGRLATMLCEQLVRLMPELEEVSGWPQFGARRGQSAVAKALAQPIDTSEFR